MVDDTRLFCLVSIGQPHLWEEDFGLFVDTPPDDAHLACVAKTGTLACDLVLLMGPMDQIVAGLAQRHQIVWAISPGFPALDVVNVQNPVLRFASAPLADMTITPEHIFSDIPKVELWSLLILLPFNFRMLDLLDVKLGHFNDDLVHWQQGMNPEHRLDVRIDPVLNRRGKPAIRLSAVQKPASPIAGCATSSGTTELTTASCQLLNIRSLLDFCLEQDGLFCCSRNPDMSGSCIDAKGHLLFVTGTSIAQLQCEWYHFDHFGLARFQQEPCLSWPTGH